MFWVLLAIAAIWLFNLGAFDGLFDQQIPDQNQQQQDNSATDDKKQATPHDLTDGFLVVVEETKNRPVERQKVFDNFQFWQNLKSQGLAGWRRYDPDSNKATSFVERAKQDGVEAPFVMLVSNGKVLDLIPFPNSIEPIKAMLR